MSYSRWRTKNEAFLFKKCRSLMSIYPTSRLLLDAECRLFFSIGGAFECRNRISGRSLLLFQRSAVAREFSRFKQGFPLDF